MLRLDENQSGEASIRAAGHHKFTASMIGAVCDGGQGSQASFVTRNFTLATIGDGATLHISALGLYRAFINGTRVGEDYLTPAGLATMTGSPIRTMTFHRFW